jgi:hypothetical protein
MAAWRWHDLRRTVRTNLSRLRVPDHVAEVVIGHIPQGLAAVYTLLAFADFADQAGVAWPSQSTIAGMLQVETRSVRREIAALGRRRRVDPGGEAQAWRRRLSPCLPRCGVSRPRTLFFDFDGNRSCCYRFN